MLLAGREGERWEAGQSENEALNLPAYGVNGKRHARAAEAVPDRSPQYAALSCLFVHAAKATFASSRSICLIGIDRSAIGSESSL